MPKQKKPYIYPTYNSNRTHQISAFNPNRGNYEDIFNFLKKFFNINENDINEENVNTFVELISSVFTKQKNNKMFGTTEFQKYMQIKKDYEKTQLDIKFLLFDYVRMYYDETGMDLSFLLNQTDSSASFTTILDELGLKYGLSDGPSSYYFNQMRKMVMNLSEQENRYAQALSKINIQAEKRMSQLRTNLYNQDNANGQTINDKFVYAFFRTIKDDNGLEKIKVEFLDAKKVLEHNAKIQLKQNFSPEGLFRSASLNQQQGFTDEEFEKMWVKDTYLKNLASQINNNQDFSNAVLALSQQTYNTKNGIRQIGLGRAADILFRGWDYQNGWNGVIPQISAKDMAENIPGLLVGDMAMDIQTRNGIMRTQFSVKTQDYNNILIDHASSAMIESMYFLGTHPKLLAKMLLSPQYSTALHADLSQQSLEQAVTDNLIFSLFNEQEEFSNALISQGADQITNGVVTKITSMGYDASWEDL